MFAEFSNQNINTHEMAHFYVFLKIDNISKAIINDAILVIYVDICTVIFQSYNG